VDYACNLLDLLVWAGAEIETDVTTESMSDALQGLGSFELAGFGPSSFGPDKFDAGDEARVVGYCTECECWTAEGDFVPVDE